MAKLASTKIWEFIMTKIVVKADPELNTLFLVLTGEPTVEKVRALRVIIESEMTKLQPGFHVYNDSREFHPANNDSYDEILELCKLVVDKQPDRIARLLNPYSRMIFNRVAAQIGYAGREFNSVKAALEYLEIDQQSPIVSIIDSKE